MLRLTLQAPLAGDGLVLRPWTAADRPVMPALFDDPDVARFTPIESPFDDAAAGRYLERIADQERSGVAVHLAVTTDGGAALGDAIAFLPRNVPTDATSAGSDGGGAAGDPSRTIELGYAIGPAHRGRGLASRSVRLLGTAVAEQAGATRLVLRIDAGNVASERVAAATGYTCTGVVADGTAVVWERLIPPA